MATEVVHGDAPEFQRATVNMNEGYICVVVGHYTDKDGLAAAGVRFSAYQSNRPAKRQNELLALRSAFHNWFVREWIANGGTVGEALEHLAANSSGYPMPQRPAPETQRP